MNITNFRTLIADQLEIDRGVERLQMSGRNLEVLLREASTQLAVPVSKLDYEIEERGTRGLLALIRPKDYRILVYRSEVDRSGDQLQFESEMVAQQDTFAPIPGKMFVHVRPDGVYLKLQPPKNEGRPIAEQDVLLQINRYLGLQSKRRLIRDLCESQACNYTKVADISHRSRADAQITIQVSQDRMQAHAILSEPGDHGAHIQHSTMLSTLKQHGVVNGYSEAQLSDLCDEPIYNQPVLVAQGKASVDGHNLYIEIFSDFKGDLSDIEEIGGKINLRSRGNFHIVTEETVIGILHPPSSGEEGCDVFGEKLEAKAGEEKPYIIGPGCVYNEETHEIITTTSGEVIFDEEQQAIKVLEIYVVQGNLQNDIDFPGSVMIKGDVENGYNIKADSNITIMGHLGKTNIECGGQLVIKAGINAVDSFHNILIRAKGNIYTRYINNAGVSSNKSIIVGDGILGSTLFAEEYIICHGRRGVINASVINARWGIYAKNFGSTSGTSTDLIVATPKKLQEERESLQAKYEEFRTRIKPLKQGLTVQNRQKEIMSQSGTISSEMQEQINEKMDSLNEEIRQVEEIMRTINTRLQEIYSETEELSKSAFISNERIVHSGVVLTIGIHHMDIQTTYSKGLTFCLKNNEITPTPLEDFDLKQFELNDVL